MGMQLPVLADNQPD